MPTVLEVFSATYPEAMALPIVTSDLDFARDICDNAYMNLLSHLVQGRAFFAG